jgi:hypothetical protein
MLYVNTYHRRKIYQEPCHDRTWQGHAEPTHLNRTETTNCGATERTHDRSHDGPRQRISANAWRGRTCKIHTLRNRHEGVWGLVGSDIATLLFPFFRSRYRRVWVGRTIPGTPEDRLGLSLDEGAGRSRSHFLDRSAQAVVDVLESHKMDQETSGPVRNDRGSIAPANRTPNKMNGARRDWKPTANSSPIWKLLGKNNLQSNQQKILAVINPEIWYHMIMIKLMNLGVLPDLSQWLHQMGNLLITRWT